MTNAIEIELAGERIELLAERALWWGARRTLLVADLHLGKASAFRASGIPVPEDVTGADLDRLGRLLDRTNAERLVILGDLLHARSGRSRVTMEAFEHWRRSRASLDVQLIRGNHDASAGDPPPDWAIECAEQGLEEAPFVYRHEPARDGRGYVLSGHLHPAIVLRGAGRSSLRSACFWIRERERVAVLPAFGSFTGKRAIRPRAGDRVFALGEERVVEVKSTPPALAPTPARDPARR